MPTKVGTWTARLPLPAAGRWPTSQALAAAIFVAAAVAAFLLVRRAGGAFAGPLPAGMLVAAALLMLAWGVAVQTLSAWQARAAASDRGAGFSRVLTTLVLGLFAVACSWPASRLVDWAVWLPIIAANWLWRHVLTSGQAALATAGAAPNTTPSLARREGLSTGNVAPDEVMQQLTRLRTAEGQQLVQGLLIAEFEPGQRTATLHAAFCPPFERLPCVEASAVDGSPASVKVAQVLHQGVQLDVHLARPSEQPQRVSVELLAADSE